jgi:integrase
MAVMVCLTGPRLKNENRFLTRSNAIVHLSTWMALRPCETSALLWEDVDFEKPNGMTWSGGGEGKGTIFIHQDRQRDGSIGPTKTEDRAELPMFEELWRALKAWHDECGNPSSGFVFTRMRRRKNKNGNVPLDVGDYGRTTLRHQIDSRLGKGAYKTMYAFRRSMAAFFRDHCGLPLEYAQKMLRHRSLGTTMEHYNKTSRKNWLAGLSKAQPVIQQKMQEAKQLAAMRSPTMIDAVSIKAREVKETLPPVIDYLADLEIPQSSKTSSSEPVEVQDAPDWTTL